MAYKTKYKIKNEKKYIGDSSNIICRSLWERRVCKYLDENTNITKWGSEEISIPYYSTTDKKMHKYYPDFIIKSGDDDVSILEVKPKKQTIAPKKAKKSSKSYINECIRYTINQEKWKSAKEFCKNRNWKFIILTEDDILP